MLIVINILLTDFSLNRVIMEISLKAPYTSIQKKTFLFVIVQVLL